jgi:hypothetical protein
VSGHSIHERYHNALRGRLRFVIPFARGLRLSHSRVHRKGERCEARYDCIKAPTVIKLHAGFHETLDFIKMSRVSNLFTLLRETHRHQHNHHCDHHCHDRASIGPFVRRRIVSSRVRDLP